MPWKRFGPSFKGFWCMTHRQIKDESAASGYSFRYSAAVFSFSIIARAGLGLSVLVLSACAATHAKSETARRRHFIPSRVR